MQDPTIIKKLVHRIRRDKIWRENFQEREMFSFRVIIVFSLFLQHYSRYFRIVCPGSAQYFMLLFHNTLRNKLLGHKDLQLLLERMGFEPMVPRKIRQFSKLLLSATQPPFHNLSKGIQIIVLYF